MTRYRSFAPSTGAFIVVPEENEKSEPFSNRKQVRIFLVWWARVDSNHRSWKQQIYSLSPLATREHAHIQFCSPWIACIYYHPDGSLSTSFAEFLDFCAESKNTKAKAAQKSTFLSGFLELVTGVEPATHWLQISCAAIAPHQHGPSDLLIEYQKTRGLSISSWRAKKQPIPQTVYYTV